MFLREVVKRSQQCLIRTQKDKTKRKNELFEDQERKCPETKEINEKHCFTLSSVCQTWKRLSNANNYLIFKYYEKKTILFRYLYIVNFNDQINLIDTVDLKGNIIK